MSLLGPVLVAAVMLAAVSCAAADDPADAAEYEARRRFFLRQMAKEDPRVVMEWANKAVSDQHKYAMPPILARLSLDVKDEAALAGYRMLMEVDKAKADRGLYHFAIYPRTRMYFQFKDHLPRDITDAMVFDVKNFYHVMRAGGTDNHTWMHRSSGYLWAEYLPEVGNAPARHSKTSSPHQAGDPEGELTNLQWQTRWMKSEVKKLFTVGQGEYDSSTYINFSAASLANVVDFGRDEPMRSVAKAALDWMAAAQALKYFHGCTLGPESRGFAQSALASGTDWMNWIWWGGSARPIDLDGEVTPTRDMRHAAIVLAMSGYRPHPVIRNLALKKVALPFEARGSKPSYYGVKDNKDQEYLFFNEQYAMGTLYSPEDGVATTGTILPQTTMFKVTLRDAHEVRTFGIANGYHRHFPVEGRTPYDQYHQKRDAAINICWVNKPEDARTRHRSILGVPLGIADPVEKDGWWFWQVNRAFVAARPLNGRAAFGEATQADDKTNRPKPVESKTHRWLISPGALGGWVVQLGQQPDYADLAAFEKAVLERCRLDLSAFEAEKTVTFVSLRGDELKMKHSGGPGGRPLAWVDGRAIEFDRWPVYESPYMNQAVGSGILRVTDGKQTLTIDYSGEWPAYREGR